MTFLFIPIPLHRQKYLAKTLFFRSYFLFRVLFWVEIELKIGNRSFRSRNRVHVFLIKIFETDAWHSNDAHASLFDAHACHAPPQNSRLVHYYFGIAPFSFIGTSLPYALFTINENGQKFSVDFYGDFVALSGLDPSDKRLRHLFWKMTMMKPVRGS